MGEELNIQTAGVSLAILTLTLSACSSSTSDSSSAPATASASMSATEATSGSEDSPPSAEPSPTRTIYADVILDGKVSTAASCKSYEAQIAKYQEEAQRRISTADGKVKDSWAAASFRKNYPWVKDSLAPAFEEGIGASATKALNEFSDGQAGVVDNFDEFVRDSVQACGLDGAWGKAEAVVAKSDALADAIKSRADSKPWYPRGFGEFEDGLAWKWADGPSPCGYSRCSYSHIRVISRDGCSDGLYAEVNKLNSGGTIVDWTNDTVPVLPANTPALLTFVSYASGVDSSSLTTLNCRSL